MEDLQPALSALMSLRSSSIQINAALSRLNAALAAIALHSAASEWQADLDPATPSSTSSGRAAFMKSQASFQFNVAGRLLDFVARCLLRLQNIRYGDDYHAIFIQLGQSMKLLQGFLLLHPASRALFGMPCNMELLITCITLPDHSSLAASSTSMSQSTATSIPASPTLASIPFDFGASTSSASDPEHSPTLAELTLETLLCALVDSPENGRLFEELGGVADVVRVLRGKVDGGKGAKMKALEFLYFWLYPDQKKQTSIEGRRSSSDAPLTPRKSSQPSEIPARRSLHNHTDSTDSRLRSMLETTQDGWTPTTPSKPSRTFEHTQLALSRSAAMLSSSSPQKRSARVPFSMQYEGDDSRHESPRAKRHSLLVSQSPARLASSLSAARRSPEARRRSILGSSSMTFDSRSATPPRTPPRESGSRHIRRSSTLRNVALIDDDEAVESYLFKAPKFPASPSVERSKLSRSAAPPYSASPASLRIPKAATSSTPSGALSSHRPRQVAVEDIPESAGSTKGLFAPLRRASLSKQSDERHLPQVTVGQSDRQAQGTRERRRQVLSKYMGNVDQLLERFEGLRCAGG